MLTQIFIKPQDSGCQPEYTKIASQSFIFEPVGFFPGPALQKQALFTGGDVSILDYTYPIWSADVRNYPVLYAAGNIITGIDASIAAMGIPLPINLVPNDTVTISGNASFNNASTYIELGYDVSLIVGVYYFNCSELVAEGARVFTFIPVSNAAFDIDGKACFNADVTLESNFDFHDTRILVGYNISATCPTGCEIPSVDLNVATVSYTLDIERPCQVTPSNFIIKNCCEPIITELVNIPGLVVGNFHVDDEGNCWEVMEQSNDVTNFTRTFTDIYTTCLECQDANPCPLNLVIASCCVQGIELVSGSLPGLNVGDTFVDNYGLCWTVDSETGAPISEESITVVSIIEGDCETCTTANPCPVFYEIKSCCTSLGGVIAIPATTIIAQYDSFVDTNGICWEVGGQSDHLPTIYGIEVDTVYPYPGPGSEVSACELCKTANPCPTEYFITIKSCCDPERIEVAQVPAASMIFDEGLIFKDSWTICWEVMSFSTTGVETYPIFDWIASPTVLTFRSCLQCIGEFKGAPCLTLYEVRVCGETESAIVAINGNVTIGGIYQLYNKSIADTCYEIIGFGYPVFYIPYPIFSLTNRILYSTCEECDLMNRNTTKTLEFSECCPGFPNIIVEYTGAWTAGIGGTAMVPLSEFPEGPYTPTCVTLVGFSTATPTLYNQDGSTVNYSECFVCIINSGGCA